MNATVRRLQRHAEKEELKKHPPLPDVIVTRPFLGLIAMQVCAKKGLSDETVLLLANKLNECGTELGWRKVVREGDKEFKENVPVQCPDHPDREHLIILC